MICKNCIHSEVCKHKTESVYECEHFKYTTIKNQYDQIRNLSIEELVKVLYSAADKVCFEVCKNGTGNKYCCPIGEKVKPEACEQCIKKWLEGEVESNG